MSPNRLNSRLSRLAEQRNSQGAEHMLGLASRTLDLMRGGLTQEASQAVCRLILPETTAIAVAITDTDRVLGYEGAMAADFPPGSPIKTAGTLEVLQTGKLGMFQSYDEGDEASTELPATVRGGIVVPLLVQERACGTIKFYYRSPAEINRSQLAIARGFGQLLSTQLSTHELDRQAELTARAELKALQAQINPHFLFNTLNTIAAFTRTDPARARNLLREFSVFYRQTLESSDQLIPLARELEQTRRYLSFEHARFGEDRIAESEHVAPGCGDVLVPAFIVQPIVENAVRHAMRDEGTLHIDIRAEEDEGDVVIAVIDDGNGMDEEELIKLREKVATEHDPGYSKEKKGTGIALRNVAERLERFYGFNSGIDIMSKPGEGTCVTLRLARTAARD